MTTTNLTATIAAGLLLLGASMPGQNLRPDQVRQTHRIDPANDRAISGGLALATATVGGAALGEPSARTLSWRGISAPTEGIVYREKSGLIVDFDVSSTGKIALLAAVTTAWPDAKTKRLLRVVDSSGTQEAVEIVDATRSFAWSPDGDLLAYCTGVPDLDRDDISSTGTWLLNLATGEVRKVWEKGRHVAWASFDKALYIYQVPEPGDPTPRVLRFDPTTGSISETSRKGIHFSTTGSFYFRSKSPNYGEFDLFDSKTDTSLLRSSKVLQQLIPQPIGWLPDQDLLVFETWHYGPDLRRPEETPRTMLYDSRSDTVVDLGDSAVLGFDRSLKTVRWRAGTLERRSTQELLREGTTVPARLR